MKTENSQINILPTNRVCFGTSFTPQYVEWLGLDSKLVFDQCLNFGFDLVRLGCYWSRIEKVEGVYDLSEIESLLTLCQARGQLVVLTVGMKAPHWPEFYVPQFYDQQNLANLEDKVLKFVSHCVEKLERYNCIAYLQIENEPLDPSGPDKLLVPLTILQQEIFRVRELTDKPIIVTLWGSDLIRRNLYPDVEKLEVDVIGLDLYAKEAVVANQYLSPTQPVSRLKQYVESSSIPIWVTELQAEPWEINEVLLRSPNPKSLNAKSLRKNVEDALKIKPAALFFWGFEYWHYRVKQFNDPSLLDTARDLIEKSF